MGSLLDDGTPDRVEEAVKAYRRALEQDPDLVAALINLANIRYSRDELAEAQALYERAISAGRFLLRGAFQPRQHPSRSRALRRSEGVVSHRAGAQLQLRRRALLSRGDPRKMGRSIDARVHWKAYERLAPNGEWVELAREFSD
jgi:tetratricopeptide (TPR) repeat protein